MAVTATARWSGALVILFLAATAASAVDLPASCTVNKRKAAAKKAATKLNCVAKAVSKALTVDSTCIAKAEVKFSTTFAKADAKGGCPAGASAASVEATVDTCVSSIRSQLGVSAASPPQSTCTSMKLRAAGKKNSSKITCYNRAVTKYSAVDSTCLAKAEVKFSTAFAKAEAKGPCVIGGNDRAAVEADVDACVNDVRTALPAPTTTTTTSTTTTTICDAAATYLTNVTSLHNTERANAVPAPSPALAPLCYSATIASTAQSWANGCQFVHSASSYGENLAAFANDQRSTAASQSVGLWAGEEVDYTYASNTCDGCDLYDSCGFDPGCPTCCLHYTQIVWRSTQRLGCGIQYCTTGSPFGPSFPNWTLVVCNYNPPGNFIGQQPY